MQGEVNLKNITDAPTYYQKWYKSVVIDDVIKHPSGYNFAYKRTNSATIRTIPTADPFDKSIVKSTIEDGIANLYNWAANRKADDYFEAVMDINFLRDAWRADVAAANSFVFITSDRMAYIYYCMVCKWNNQERRGFYFHAIDKQLNCIV